MSKFIQNILKPAALALSGLLALASPAAATELEIKTGFDVFTSPTAQLTSFHYVTGAVDLGNGFYFGQSIYSSATGYRGGLFVGGIEAYKRFNLTERTAIDLGAFLGGGGGAELIYGDGLMARLNASVVHAITPNLKGSLGVSWIAIKDAPVAGPAISAGVVVPLHMAVSGGFTDHKPANGTVIAAIKPFARSYITINSTRRWSTRPVDNMYLVGAELTFRAEPGARREVFVRLAGAMAGDGEGYAEIQAGPRWYTKGEWVRGFFDVGLGLSGGGEVDTGGGLIGTASLGISANLWPGLGVEAGIGGVKSFTGNFQAATVFARSVINLDDPRAHAKGGLWASRRWQMSTGLHYSFEHPGLRRPPPRGPLGGNPVLYESSLDLFFGKHFYVFGSGLTAVWGDVGGYAIGAVGVGYELPIGDRFAVAVEGFAGAGAGGGINTNGGLIYGGRVEADYALNKNLKLNVGAGRYFSRGPASPWFVQAGLKIPFTSHHGR
ncbi:MAG: hypothetical protein ACRBCL_03005 [Maritimibacter sp.]